MRCRICREGAGGLRRRCSDCGRLAELFVAHRGADMSTLMDMFIASGAPRHKVDKFLNADVDGQGTVRDQIASNMANDLLAALGQRGRQTATDVRRIRQRGAWVASDRRPTE